MTTSLSPVSQCHLSQSQLDFLHTKITYFTRSIKLVDSFYLANPKQMYDSNKHYYKRCVACLKEVFSAQELERIARTASLPLVKSRVHCDGCDGEVDAFTIELYTENPSLCGGFYILISRRIDKDFYERRVIPSM